MATSEKEFLYVGHYIDTDGNYILKIGTTNDLKRRAQEHSRNYKKDKKYTMPSNEVFTYDWTHKLSWLNTLRFEKVNRAIWKEKSVGEFVRNDRFNCGHKPPKSVTIKIKKEYKINLR